MHAHALPRLMRYADPAGATEIAEFRRMNHKIRRAKNEIGPGIALVNARIQTGRLRVLASACPNLIAESKLYAYPEPTSDGACDENPIDQHNHALAALRYLVRSIDAGGPVRPLLLHDDGGGPPEKPKRASGMNPDGDQL